MYTLGKELWILLSHFEGGGMQVSTICREAADVNSDHLPSCSFQRSAMCSVKTKVFFLLLLGAGTGNLFPGWRAGGPRWNNSPT